MSLPRYPNYKNSGAAWLGNIPAHWEIRPLKSIVSTPITDGPHETPVFGDEGVPFVSAEAVSSGFIDFGKIRGHISLEDHTRFSQKYKPLLHDIYMVKSGATTGVTAIVETDKEFNIWSPLAALRCNTQVALPYFILNFLRSRNFQEAVALNWSFGTQQNIGMGVLGDLPIALPPGYEQTAIITFLARETGKIDALVAEQEKLIALLTEKRQAAISHAVTKGLNPDAPMKDSGVAWLGDVPAHWKVLTFQRCVNVAEGQVNPEREPFRSMLLIAPNHVESGTGRLLALETAEEQGAESGKYLCSKGDVIYSKIRPALRKVCIAPERCLCSADMYPLRGIVGLTNRFLMSFMLSEPFSALVVLESERVAMPKINRESLKAVWLALPPNEEQESIASFLERETQRLDALTSDATRNINLLKERRSALIAAVVTGQIDVREAATC